MYLKYYSILPDDKLSVVQICDTAILINLLSQAVHMDQFYSALCFADRRTSDRSAMAAGSQHWIL